MTGTPVCTCERDGDGNTIRLCTPHVRGEIRDPAPKLSAKEAAEWAALAELMGEGSGAGNEFWTPHYWSEVSSIAGL